MDAIVEAGGHITTHLAKQHHAINFYKNREKSVSLPGHMSRSV